MFWGWLGSLPITFMHFFKRHISPINQQNVEVHSWSPWSYYPIRCIWSSLSIPSFHNHNHCGTPVIIFIIISGYHCHHFHTGKAPHSHDHQHDRIFMIISTISTGAANIWHRSIWSWIYDHDEWWSCECGPLPVWKIWPWPPEIFMKLMTVPQWLWNIFMADGRWWSYDHDDHMMMWSWMYLWSWSHDDDIWSWWWSWSWWSWPYGNDDHMEMMIMMPMRWMCVRIIMVFRNGDMCNGHESSEIWITRYESFWFAVFLKFLSIMNPHAFLIDDSSAPIYMFIGSSRFTITWYDKFNAQNIFKQSTSKGCARRGKMKKMYKLLLVCASL